MNQTEIMDEMARISKDLQEKLNSIVPCATKMATTQRDYRVSLASEILRLRASGESVSLAEVIAKGNVEVADKKVFSIIADSEHKVCVKGLAVGLGVADILRSLLKASKDEDTAARKNYYD